MAKQAVLFLKDYLPIKYEYFENNPNNLYKKPNKVKCYHDCVVRALCKVSGLGWSTVYDMLVKESYKKHDMPNTDAVVNRVAASLGFRHKKVTCMALAFMLAHPNGTYVISIYGHSFAYIDGTIYDCSVNGKEMDGFDLDSLFTTPIDHVYYKYTDTLNLQ